MHSKGTRYPGAPRKPDECLEARQVDFPPRQPSSFPPLPPRRRRGRGQRRRRGGQYPRRRELTEPSCCSATCSWDSPYCGKRKLVANVAVGTECSAPIVCADGSSNRTDRGWSVQSVLVSDRSSQVPSSPRPRKRVTFADVTPVSAWVSECRRGTQKPHRTNLRVMGGVRTDHNTIKTTAGHSSMLACKSYPFLCSFRLAGCRLLAL